MRLCLVLDEMRRSQPKSYDAKDKPGRNLVLHLRVTTINFFLSLGRDKKLKVTKVREPTRQVEFKLEL